MMQNSAVVKDVSTATLLASTGAYKGQPGFANDAGFGSGLEYFWDTAGTPAWKLASRWQQLAVLRTPWTAPTDNTNENVALTYTLPKLGPNDILLVQAFWTVVNNANVKTARVNIGTAGSMVTGHSMALASRDSGNVYVQSRNRNATNSQAWFTNNIGIWGASSGSIQTTTKETGTAGLLLQVTAQKATQGDSMVLEFADFWVFGGG